jgi:hypothetical protein
MIVSSLGFPGEGMSFPRVEAKQASVRRWHIHFRLVPGRNWFPAPFESPLTFDEANEILRSHSHLRAIQLRAVAPLGLGVGLVPVIDNSETTL